MIVEESEIALLEVGNIVAVLIGHGEDEVDLVDADAKDLARVFGRLPIGDGLLLRTGRLRRGGLLSRRGLLAGWRRGQRRSGGGGLLLRGSLCRIRSGLLLPEGRLPGGGEAQCRCKGRQTGEFCPHISVHSNNLWSGSRIRSHEY